MIATFTNPIAKDLFFSKNDPEDVRLGEIVKPLSDFSQIREGDFCIIGYPDDEGIKLNGGRPGAAEAPNTIRKILYKMTPSLNNLNTPQIWECGNLKIEGVTLEGRHDNASQVVKNILAQGGRVISLGGGHDYGFSDLDPFCEKALEENLRPQVINFDAHLDVRSDDVSQHSGTSFNRLLKKHSGQIDFFEVGIQDWCNSRYHVEWAQKQGAQIITWDELQSSKLSLTELMLRDIFGQSSPKTPLALSLDIDGFSSAVCPGASQVFPVGFEAQDFLDMWRVVVKRFQPQVCAFYEVSPVFDLDHRTSRMVAILIHQLLYSTPK